MAWCLENDIQFKLYSRDAWFDARGWKAYFQPLDKEANRKIHNKINNRTGAPENKFHRYVLRNLYRVIYPSHQLTYEAWNYFRNREWESHKYRFHRLNFEGSLQHLCREITQMVWRYNEETAREVTHLRDQFDLCNQSYLGFHIRGGDKYKEDQLYPFGKYDP